MLIGLDLDNTIVGYDHVFARAAVETGMLSADKAGSKLDVRGALREQGREEDWMRLQGQVYGRFMPLARAMDGVEDFLLRAKALGITIAIVSHKTQFGHFDPDRIDLRDAARAWLDANGFFGRLGLDPDLVWFETTREEKIARLASLNPAAFVDDLPEVLGHPDFPAGVTRVLYAAEGAEEGPWRACSHWDEVSRVLLS